MNIEEIVSGLKEFRAEIVTMLAAQKWGHFRKYFVITENFDANAIHDHLKKAFCIFYRMNGARGLNSAQKKKFFELLSSRETDLEKILITLFEVAGHSSRHNLFLSFGTKLIHTIDHDSPIYDANIAHVLRLASQTYYSAHRDRIANRLQIYDALKNDFKALSKDQKIKHYLKDMRKEIGGLMSDDGFEWRGDLISDVKLLDSLLWALSPILKKAWSSYPKLTKEESAFFDHLRVTERFSKHYVQFGMPLRTQIGKALLIMSHSKVNPESKLSAGKIGMEAARKHYLKACEYVPLCAQTNDRLRKKLGL